MSAPPVIIQARFGSARLPGKVLRPLAGRPLLLHLIERLRRCRRIGGVVLATSADPADDPVARFGAEEGVAVARGPLDDVAARLLLAAGDHPAFVRVSGDSPFLDPALVDRAVALFEAESCDLATNILVRSFPKGQSVEVIATAALRRALDLMTEPGDREHVTPVFYRHSDRFRIVDFRCGRPLGAVQLSVDTEEDFARAAAIVAAMDRPSRDYDLDGVLDLRRRTAGGGKDA